MTDRVRFPKRHADGSFCVRVALSCQEGVASDELAGRLSEWFAEWTANNENWEWLGRTQKYSSEFDGPPSDVRVEGSRLTFRLRGAPAATKLWRDWLALRIVRDLVDAFPQIAGVERIAESPLPEPGAE